MIDEVRIDVLKVGETIRQPLGNGRIVVLTLLSGGCFQGYISEFRDGVEHRFITDPGPKNYVVKLLQIANSQSVIR